jgi:hypothetical protein
MLAIAATLGACAAPQQYFTKPGFDEAAFQRDKYECNKDGFAAGGAVTMYGVTQRTFNRELALQCMGSKGYSLVTRP